MGGGWWVVVVVVVHRAKTRTSEPHFIESNREPEPEARTCQYHGRETRPEAREGGGGGSWVFSDISEATMIVKCRVLMSGHVITTTQERD